MMSQSVSDAIVRVIAYCDYFKYPLTSEEIRCMLAVPCRDTKQLEAALNQWCAEGEIICRDGYYCFTDHTTDIVNKRLEDEKRAAPLKAKAERIARWMAFIPFVRGVLLTGSLSKNVADASDDIDYLIIVPHGRVWLVRTLFTVIKKIFLLNDNDNFCVNYILAEDGLEIPFKSYYTAYETATVKMLWNAKALDRFQENNRWIHDFLPNWKFPSHPSKSEANPSYVQRFLEWVCFPLVIPGMDTFLRRIWDKIWKWRHPELQQSQRDKLFSTTDQASSRWNIDYGALIEAHIEQRLQRKQNLAG
ncbi:hypothetical protein L6Q79_13745 [bacterium]|nr:hypothetical protein [bacterium]NUN46749.1 hypothetical protein [bacterium]